MHAVHMFGLQNNGEKQCYNHGIITLGLLATMSRLSNSGEAKHNNRSCYANL